jgi:hypothetical protein
MNKIGVPFEIASVYCRIVTSVTLEALGILFACHSVILKRNYLLKTPIVE